MFSSGWGGEEKKEMKEGPKPKKVDIYRGSDPPSVRKIRFEVVWIRVSRGGCL